MMDHLDHERAKLKLRYLPFNYPAMQWHGREGNRKINERLEREKGWQRDTLYDPIMSDA